jgi:hypothetical protein
MGVVIEAIAQLIAHGASPVNQTLAMHVFGAPWITALGDDRCVTPASHGSRTPIALESIHIV